MVRPRPRLRWDKKMHGFQLAHIFAHHVLAGIQVIAQPRIAREAAPLLPGIAQEDGVQQLGITGEVAGIQDELGKQDKPMRKGRIFDQERIRLLFLQGELGSMLSVAGISSHTAQVGNTLRWG